jgi:hypothetical protein
LKTFQFNVGVRFEARGEAQAKKVADRIIKLLEHGSPSESLRDLDCEARFSDATDGPDLKEIE